MGKRLTESFKLQMIATRKAAKKAKMEKQRPTFKNLKVGYDRATANDIQVVVTNALVVDEREQTTKAVLVDATGSTFIIKSIECPICHKEAPINPAWNGYICPKNDQHEKKVYEICRAL